MTEPILPQPLTADEEKAMRERFNYELCPQLTRPGLYDKGGLPCTLEIYHDKSHSHSRGDWEARRLLATLDRDRPPQVIATPEPEKGTPDLTSGAALEGGGFLKFGINAK
jgi:hypothetical protein